jgi:hypothetical protein
MSDRETVHIPVAQKRVKGDTGGLDSVRPSLASASYVWNCLRTGGCHIDGDQQKPRTAEYDLLTFREASTKGLLLPTALDFLREMTRSDPKVSGFGTMPISLG